MPKSVSETITILPRQTQFRRANEESTFGRRANENFGSNGVPFDSYSRPLLSLPFDE